MLFWWFSKRCFSTTMKLCTKKDTFLTSSWAPLDLEKAINTNRFLSILLLQKDDILKRFWGPPKFTEIEKGLPVKDVEQKLMISVFFGVARKGPYCFPSRTESKNHRFWEVLGRMFGLVRPRSAAEAHPPLKDILPQRPYESWVSYLKLLECWVL